MFARISELYCVTDLFHVMICSIDEAEQTWLDWWKYDQHLSQGREQVRLLARRITALTRGSKGRRRRVGPAEWIE